MLENSLSLSKLLVVITEQDTSDKHNYMKPLGNNSRHSFTNMHQRKTASVVVCRVNVRVGGWRHVHHTRTHVQTHELWRLALLAAELLTLCLLQCPPWLGREGHRCPSPLQPRRGGGLVLLPAPLVPGLSRRLAGCLLAGATLQLVASAATGWLVLPLALPACLLWQLLAARHQRSPAGRLHGSGATLAAPRVVAAACSEQAAKIGCPLELVGAKSIANMACSASASARHRTRTLRASRRYARLGSTCACLEVLLCASSL